MTTKTSAEATTSLNMLTIVGEDFVLLPKDFKLPPTQMEIDAINFRKNKEAAPKAKAESQTR